MEAHASHNIGQRNSEKEKKRNPRGITTPNFKHTAQPLQPTQHGTCIKTEKWINLIGQSPQK